MEVDQESNKRERRKRQTWRRELFFCLSHSNSQLTLKILPHFFTECASLEPYMKLNVLTPKPLLGNRTFQKKKILFFCLYYFNFQLTFRILLCLFTECKSRNPHLKLNIPIPKPSMKVGNRTPQEKKRFFFCLTLTLNSFLEYYLASLQSMGIDTHI